MTHDEFVKNYLGKGIDYDKQHSFQCVDVIRQYLKDVHQVDPYKVIPPVVGAHQIYARASSDYFLKIPLSSGEIPRVGDIIIWDSTFGKGYGHVAVVLSSIRNTFEVIEQDGITNSVSQKTAYRSYKGVIGWLKVKSTISGDQGASKTMLEIDKETFEKLVTKSTKYDEFVAKNITAESVDALKNDLSNTQKRERELNSELDERKSELELVKREREDAKDKHQKDLETFAAKLATTAEMSALVPALDTALEVETEKQALEKKLEEVEAFYLKRLEEKEQKIKALEERLNSLEESHKREMSDLASKHQSEIDRIKSDVSTALESVQEMKKEEQVVQAETKKTRSLFDKFLDLVWR